MFEPLNDPERQREIRIENFLDGIPMQTGARNVIRDQMLSQRMCGPRSLISALSGFIDLHEEHRPFSEDLVEDIVEKRTKSLDSKDIYDTELDNLALILSTSIKELGMVGIDYKFVVPRTYVSYAGYQDKIEIAPSRLAAEGLRKSIEEQIQVVIGVKGIGNEPDHIAHITFDKSNNQFTSLSDFRVPELVDEDIKQERLKYIALIGPADKLQE